ncbi:hypothetical protein HT031_001201 [Scenedesmus sp. PABB004]|nr:hypothetical protein HT031_001201 [Scenedesmus sp. PABB004]
MSAIAALALGNGAGACIRGITGFGSAIVVLFVWVACTTAGVDAGSLQQAVVSECVCSVVLALPMLWATRACTTCDWRLVSPLLVFGALGAPAGAALLTRLDPRRTELAMACVLLLVIALQARVAQRVRAAAGSVGAGAAAALRGRQPSGSLGGGARAALELARGGGGGRDGGGGSGAAVAPASAPAAAASAWPPPSSCEGLSLRVDSTTAACEGLSLQVGSTTAACEGSSLRVGSTTAACEGLPLRVGSAAAACEGADPRHPAEGEVAALLPDTGRGGGDACTGGWRRRVRARLAAAWAPERRGELLRTLGAAAVAGTTSGLMGGMTGMAGPPLMLLFERLQVPKDVVRGSSSVLNVLQTRVVAYALMGAFVRDDIPLYAAAAAAALAGVAAGNALAAAMSQAAFSRLLAALMVLCCLLLFASAAGLAGR